jgi:hypothetical protein
MGPLLRGEFPDGNLEPQVQEDYKAFANGVMQKFQGIAAYSMSAQNVADKIWEAATDGKDQLRYFVGPKDAGLALKFRLMGGAEGDFDPEGIDAKYMRGMKAIFE